MSTYIITIFNKFYQILGHATLRHVTSKNKAPCYQQEINNHTKVHIICMRRITLIRFVIEIIAQIKTCDG